MTSDCVVTYDAPYDSDYVIASHFGSWQTDGMPEPTSPLSYAVERIGDRWTILIVDALMDGPRKFGEIETMVGGIAPTVLTKRLRQLGTDGIVVARPYSERPIRLFTMPRHTR